MRNQRAKSYNSLNPLPTPISDDKSFMNAVEEFNLGSEAINMHYLWLRNISDIITDFMNSYLKRDYERQLDMLKLLETITSPKIDNDDVEKTLDWVEKNLEKALIKDADGVVIRYNPILVGEIKKKLLDTFRIMLLKLELKGILTFEQKNPGRSMGRFSNA